MTTRPDLRILFDVPIPGGIYVAEWVPSEVGRALACSLAEGTTAKLWVPADLLDGGLEDTPSGAKCNTLRLRLDMTGVPPSLLSALAQKEPGQYPEGQLSVWLRGIYEEVATLVNRFLSHVEHETGQAFVKRLETDCPDTLFRESNARWSTDGIAWNRLKGPQDDTTTLRICVPKAVKKQDWAAIEAFLNLGRDVDITKRIATRAINLADDGDLRMAVLEAAICLERELAHRIHAYLQCRSVAEGLVDVRGATRMLEAWLPRIRPATDQEALRAAKRVIEQRNSIMHKAEIEVPPGIEADLRVVVELARALCDERRARSAEQAQAPDAP